MTFTILCLVGLCAIKHWSDERKLREREVARHWREVREKNAKLYDNI